MTHRILAAVTAIIVGVATLAGCTVERNPRRDACKWHDSAATSQTTWVRNANYERGGYCTLVDGRIPLSQKDECSRVIRARGRLGKYTPRLQGADAEFYCYGIRGA